MTGGVWKRVTVVLAGGLIPAGRQLLPDYERLPVSRQKSASVGKGDTESVAKGTSLEVAQ